MSETVLPTTQTTSPTTPHCQRFSPRWSALWAPRRPEPRPHHHQTGGIVLLEVHGQAWPTSRASPNGGNCSIRGATRRRHAEAKLLMVQNPHSQRCDALRKGQRARSGPGAACFPMTPLTNGGKCTMRGARSGSPHVEGATKRGNCTIRAATRRRHAVGRLLMVQNPPSPKMRSKTLYPTADSPHHDGTPVSNDDEFP